MSATSPHAEVGAIFAVPSTFFNALCEVRMVAFEP